MDDEHPATMIGSPVELTRADYVEIKITADRVYVLFRKVRLGLGIALAATASVQRSGRHLAGVMFGACTPFLRA